jgi:type III secretion system FlhB-like substrate exporter
MTTKKKNRPKRVELERRARAIVADESKDYDSRMTLATALRDGKPSDEDLAAMVAQAEAGEMVEAPYDEIEEDYRGAAHVTLRFMDGDACPFWLLSAMQTAFDAASAAHGIEIWKRVPPAYREDPEAEGDGYSAKALADLFRVSEGFNLELITRPTLAEHIAAVLADEDTPEPLYNALAEAVTTLTAQSAVTNSAEVIRLALALDAEEKGGAR